MSNKIGFYSLTLNAMLLNSLFKKLNTPFKNIGLYSWFQTKLIQEGAVEKEASSIRDTLRKRGYSEKALDEIFKWYNSSTEKTPKNVS